MGSSLTLPPLTAATAVTQWQFAPILTALVVLAAVAYLWGVRRVAARHPARPWPAWRTGMFLGGLAVIVLATESGVGAYDDVLFWDHMIQHLLLIGVAPPMLVTGQPVMLLLHASRNPLHTWTKRLMRSRVVTYLTWPVFGLVAYAATIAGTHLTGFMNLVLLNDTVHEAEHALYVVVGYLYFLPLIGREPIRWRLSYPIRMLVLFLAMPVDAFTGVALMSYSSNPFPPLAALHRASGLGSGVLDDVHTGGGVMWVGGAGIMFALIMLTFFAWTRERPATSGHGWLEAARRDNLAQLTGVDTVARVDTGRGMVGSPDTVVPPQGAGVPPGPEVVGSAPTGAADAPTGAGDAPASVTGTPRTRPPRPRRVDIDEDEEQLAAYNAFLARINAAERSRQD